MSQSYSSVSWTGCVTWRDGDQTDLSKVSGYINLLAKIGLFVGFGSNRLKAIEVAGELTFKWTEALPWMSLFCRYFYELSMGLVKVRAIESDLKTLQQNECRGVMGK